MARPCRADESLSHTGLQYSQRSRCQRGYFQGATGITRPTIALQRAHAAINLQQPISEVAACVILGSQHRQFDRIPQQVCPTLLSLREVHVHARLIADHDSNERLGVSWNLRHFMQTSFQVIDCGSTVLSSTKECSKRLVGYGIICRAMKHLSTEGNSQSVLKNG